MTRTELADRTKTWFDSDGVTRAMKVIALVSLLLALFVSLKQTELTGCLADYNDANNRITQARAQAADQDRQALDQMIRAISSAHTGEQAAKALQTYLMNRDQADAQRAANPLPPPPSATC